MSQVDAFLAQGCVASVAKGYQAKPVHLRVGLINERRACSLSLVCRHSKKHALIIFVIIEKNYDLSRRRIIYKRKELLLLDLDMVTFRFGNVTSLCVGWRKI